MTLSHQFLCMDHLHTWTSDCTCVSVTNTYTCRTRTIRSRRPHPNGINWISHTRL